MSTVGDRTKDASAVGFPTDAAQQTCFHDTPCSHTGLMEAANTRKDDKE